MITRSTMKSKHDDSLDGHTAPMAKRPRINIPKERHINDIEAFSGAPHFELIRPGKRIVIPSVLVTFEQGITELFPFLAACRMLNCSVTFKKERITIPSRSEDCWRDFSIQMRRYIAGAPKNADACRRYLGNVEKMGLIEELSDDSEND